MRDLNDKDGNWLIRRRGVGRIDNLKATDEPIFKAIFGEDWDALPPVMHRHYANRPYSTEVNRVRGTLDVFCKPPLLWFAPIMKFLGQVPACNEQNVAVQVDFESDRYSRAFQFNRTFYFNQEKPYVFRSRMLPAGRNAMFEVMRWGLTWKAAFTWDGNKVVMTHRGYAFHLWGYFLPLPLTFILGAGNAWEQPVSDTVFVMSMNIRHPWWGEIYGYSGQFEVIP